jgi:hypothetical protein
LPIKIIEAKIIDVRALTYMDRITPNIAKVIAKRIAKRIIAIIILPTTFIPSVAVLNFSIKTSNGLKVFGDFMTSVISLINQLSLKRKNAKNSQWAKKERMK